ncbi:MAG: hypothetical protein WCH77_00885 [Planctomycetota bacterium]
MARIVRFVQTATIDFYSVDLVARSDASLQHDVLSAPLKYGPTPAETADAFVRGGVYLWHGISAASIQQSPSCRRDGGRGRHRVGW